MPLFLIFFPFPFSLLLSLSRSISPSLSLSLFLLKTLSLSGTWKYYWTSDFDSPGDYFFVWGKTYNEAFLGIFRGSLDFFGHLIVLRVASKKVLAPFEKSFEMPHFMFCLRKTKISRTFKISSTLIIHKYQWFNLTAYRLMPLLTP